MKAIIISDTDARALLNKLELTKLKEAGHLRGIEAEVSASLHRTYHYVVVKWLQEQGADCVGT
jgi:hypothetical protein